MRRCIPALTLMLLAAPLTHPAHGQELRIKREIPATAWGGCSEVVPPAPAEEARQRAERLADEASQAAILGDNTRALDLLRGAASLDPSSPAVAYQQGRALEDAGRGSDAVSAYCRYLALAPAATDADDVRGRIAALVPGDDAMPEAAVVAFRAGITAFDQGRLVEAEAAFGRALQAAPAWSAAVYNRGAARVATGNLPHASADLRRYLELSPGAPDFEQVLDVITAMRGAEPRRASGALVAGLFVPGLGHFTTGRPVPGMLVLGAAAGAAAAGFLTERTEVDCLTVPVSGACPGEHVLRTRTERPYLLVGLAGAAVVTVAGALEAWHGARRRDRPGAGTIRVTGAASDDRTVVLATPGIHIDSDGARLELIRLRF